MSRMKKFQDIQYSPDFSLKTSTDVFYIETKGFPNDRYPMYRKMFIRQLCKEAMETGLNYHFFEPHTKTEVQQTCETIKTIIKENGGNYTNN